jgi:NAD(P)-dependent dehydrogenase (short-subunit alcohol dehydrogenase family)
MLQPDGRVILVSGASRGIGRAVVDRLVNAGFTVAAGLRDPSRLHPRERLSVHLYDAEAPDAAERWVAEAVAKWDRIDGLVNAAGINPKMRVSDIGEDALDEMWRINVKGPLRMIRAALPYLAAGGSGRVIKLGSLSGKRVASNVGYAMSKFALVALTHGIRREGRDAGIRATVICPGYVATDMTINETEIPRHDMTQPEDLAALVETMLRLPNNAAVSELLVCSQYEPML